MEFKQTIKIFGVLFGVLLFGVLLGVSLADIGYVPVRATPIEAADIFVELVVDYGNGDTQSFPQQELRGGGSVLDALEQSGVSLEKRNYPGLGVFIEAINGVHNSNNFYWQYWVNGEYANVAAGQYMLRGGERILWKRTDEI